jgi:hypothetical protein
MNSTSAFSGLLNRVVMHPSRGVVGLVDELLAACREHDLDLDWQADCCRVRTAGRDWEEVVDVRLRKSVFRAILARVALLCNEQTPNSLSPYGGQGEIRFGPSPTATFRIALTNTPSEQRLKLTGLPMENARPDGEERSKRHTQPGATPGL